uniref:Sister chromatid cohesion protein DCC1 n=1 Tax=Ascaris suum TaxID=6253 RepID=F1LBX7_ASCSU
MERFLKKTAVPGSSNAAAHRTLNASTTEVEVGQKQLPCVSLSMRSTRANIDNTKKLLDIAKLFDVKGEVQQIEFSSPLLSGDYRLIEVNPKLADRIESGERLVFRGELDDNPVLCTQQETYQVKEAETSNTLLVLPAVHFANEVGNGDHFLTARKVVAMHSQYVELRKLDVISLNRLKELLRENEIDWDETENPEQEGKSYTLDDLLDVVQMSEEQLMNALHYLPVIHQHGGYVSYI